MAAKQFQLQGHIDDSMLLVNVFQFIYVFDAFQSEVGGWVACVRGEVVHKRCP